MFGLCPIQKNGAIQKDLIADNEWSPYKCRCYIFVVWAPLSSLLLTCLFCGRHRTEKEQISLLSCATRDASQAKRAPLHSPHLCPGPRACSASQWPLQPLHLCPGPQAHSASQRISGLNPTQAEQSKPSKASQAKQAEQSECC